MEEEIKKFAYFIFNRATDDEKKEYVEFLKNFSEVTYPENYIPYPCWRVERGLIRRLKLKNIDQGLDESYKKFVRFMCNENLVRYYGETPPRYESSTTGSSGLSGSSGSSGTDGIAIPKGAILVGTTSTSAIYQINPFFEILEDLKNNDL